MTRSMILLVLRYILILVEDRAWLAYKQPILSAEQEVPMHVRHIIILICKKNNSVLPYEGWPRNVIAKSAASLILAPTCNIPRVSPSFFLLSGFTYKQNPLGRRVNKSSASTDQCVNIDFRMLFRRSLSIWHASHLICEWRSKRRNRDYD